MMYNEILSGMSYKGSTSDSWKSVYRSRPLAFECYYNLKNIQDQYNADWECCLYPSLTRAFSIATSITVMVKISSISGTSFWLLRVVMLFEVCYGLSRFERWTIDGVYLVNCNYGAQTASGVAFIRTLAVPRAGLQTIMRMSHMGASLSGRLIIKVRSTQESLFGGRSKHVVVPILRALPLELLAMATNNGLSQEPVINTCTRMAIMCTM